MAETTAQVSAKLEKVDERVRGLENWRSEFQGAKGLAKLAIGISGVSLAGLLWHFFDMRSTVAVHDANITRMEKAHEAEIARLEGRIDRLTDFVLKGKLIGAAPYIGDVVKASDTELIIETTEPKEKKTFKLTPETWVIVKHKEGKLSDLKPGMTVEVLEGKDGVADKIEVIDHPTLREPKEPLKK
jgi:hypothetical protein